MTDALPYRVLLYYHYVPIDDPAGFVKEHLELCAGLGLLGRILVATEGLNGTVSGTTGSAQAYMDTLRSDPRFADIVFKVDEAEEHAFGRLIVKHKPELVSLRHERDLDPRVRTGRRMSPVEFHEALQRDDAVIIDGRNAYEYDIGHFRGAIRPDTKTFRDFPAWVRENLAGMEDRKVLTYCTGGIRCEKLSALLLDEGFRDVAQLDGGIVTYGKDPVVQGHLFDGRCYVFDRRASVKINHTADATVVGRCLHCGEPCERMVNCANTECDNQHICCVECEFKHRRSCSEECQRAPLHEFDPATAGTSKSFYR
ncbi:MAG: rhodanese-related sulfurtransferase [Candidatus Sumerlaeaceae bacterium]|nr:rhodanese-related sulfurtransferase [Candidatus Sumerlaeaceae bacterium]